MKHFPTQSQSRKNPWQISFEMFLLRRIRRLPRFMIQHQFNQVKRSRRSRVHLVSCPALGVMVLVLSHLLNLSQAAMIHVHQSQRLQHPNSPRILQLLFNSRAATTRHPPTKHPGEAIMSRKLILPETRSRRSPTSLEKLFIPTREQTTWQAFFEIVNHQV